MGVVTPLEMKHRAGLFYDRVNGNVRCCLMALEGGFRPNAGGEEYEGLTVVGEEEQCSWKEEDVGSRSLGDVRGCLISPGSQCSSAREGWRAVLRWGGGKETCNSR